MTGPEIRALMDTFYRGEGMCVPPRLMQKLREEIGVEAALAVGRPVVLSTIQGVFEASGKEGGDGYILDPHTAVGVAAAAQEGGWVEGEVVVCMGCAHPAKFAGTIQQALGFEGGEEAAVREIKKRSFAPVATALERLEGVARGGGGGGGGGEGLPCPVFRAAERKGWRKGVEEEVGELEKMG